MISSLVSSYLRSEWSEFVDVKRVEVLFGQVRLAGGGRVHFVGVCCHGESAGVLLCPVSL